MQRVRTFSWGPVKRERLPIDQDPLLHEAFGISFQSVGKANRIPTKDVEEGSDGKEAGVEVVFFHTMFVNDGFKAFVPRTWLPGRPLFFYRQTDIALSSII